VGPDFVMRGSTKPIFAMHGWAAPSWSEPRLRRADLRGAYLRLAKLDGADLSDANLSDAEGLTQAQLVLAHHNSGTKLPEGWTGLEADSPLPAASHVRTWLFFGKQTYLWRAVAITKARSSRSWFSAGETGALPSS